MSAFNVLGQWEQNARYAAGQNEREVAPGLYGAAAHSASEAAFIRSKVNDWRSVLASRDPVEPTIARVVQGDLALDLAAWLIQVDDIFRGATVDDSELARLWQSDGSSNWWMRRAPAAGHLRAAIDAYERTADG